MQHLSSDNVIAQSVESLQHRLSQEYASRDALTQKYGALQKKYDDLESRWKESQTRSQFLSNENSMLTTKLSEQITIRSKLQLSKEEMAEELEELTRSLFEEANELVSKEAKARHDTEAALSKALGELSRLQLALKDENSQLSELKQRMKDMIASSGTHLHSHLPRHFQSDTMDSSTFIASPIQFFLDSSEHEHEHGHGHHDPSCSSSPFTHAHQLEAASSIWHYISWKGLQDIWPETFEEWKNVIYFKPSGTEQAYLELEKKRLWHRSSTRHQGSSGSGGEPLNKEPDKVKAGAGAGVGAGSEKQPGFDFDFDSEPPETEETALSQIAIRRINPQWILEQLDSDLYVEFLHWLGRSSVPEPQYHAPLASSGSNLSLPSLLIQPTEFTSRPSTPQKTSMLATSSSRPSSYSLSHEVAKLSSSSSSTSSDPFMCRAWDEDILPTLSFPLRSKSFSKKLMKSIASNSVSLEAVLCPPRPSSMVGTLPGTTTITTTVPPLHPSSSSSTCSYTTPIPSLSTLTHFTTSPLSNHSYSTPLSGQLSSTFVSPSGPQVNESFASPPPMPSAATWIPIKEPGHHPKSTLFGRPAPALGNGLPDSPRSDIHDFIERARTASPDPSLNGTVCSLCGRPIRSLPPRLADTPGLDELEANEPLVHRLRLSDDESSASSLLVDSHCRSKIVSVCDFFSFVRYYRQGFYTSFTNEHLYAHWLQLKRAMMYARTGSTSYFVASDVSLLMRRWHQGWYEWCSTEAQKHSAHKKLAAKTATPTTVDDRQSSA